MEERAQENTHKNTQEDTESTANMREGRFSRTALLLGTEALEKLARAKVAVFGVGGVGGYVVEALARSGVGAFVLVDKDTVSLSNLNRQIIATEKSIGRSKVEVMRERILDINPAAEVEMRRCFFLPETAQEFDFSEFSYVVDAVDTVTAKLEIIVRAQAAGVPVISSMGAGNKLDPTAFRVADIYQTSMCPLAKVMRRELKKRGVKQLKVVYSTEPPRKPLPAAEQVVGETPGDGAAETPPAETSSAELRQKPETASTTRRSTPGSVAFVPSVAGLVAAAEVVKDLISEKYFL